MIHRLPGVCTVALAALLTVSVSFAEPAASLDSPLQGALATAGVDEMIPVVAFVAPAPDLKEIEAAVAGLTRTEKKQVVYDLLREHADKTQADLLDLLYDAEQKGTVERIQPIALNNTVAFHATREMIETVGLRTDVSVVAYNPTLPALPENGMRGLSSSELDEIAWGVQQINAPAVWDEGYTGEGILLADVDTGVNYNHTDLADHLWDGGEQYPNHGYDFNNLDDNPMDDHGHGTHTAGTAVGDGTSGTQTGVAPDATLMCLKVLNSGGSGDYADVWDALDFALANGVDVVTMSLGWPNLVAAGRVGFRQSFDALNLAGVISAVAAGNERGWSPTVPDNVRSPGTVPSPWRNPDEVEEGTRGGVITIGATTSTDAIASFSSEGPVTWMNYTPFNDYPYNGSTQVGLIKPDVSAPGVAVTSLNYQSNTGYVGGDMWSGTSMATPHVAGTIALMLNKYDDLTPAEVDSILQVSSIDLGTAGKDNDFGAGRIQADSAVGMVIGITGIVQGVVTNQNDGTPVAGAHVIFSNTGRWGLTDENGFYSVELGIGLYTMSIDQPPFQPFAFESIEVTDGDTLDINPELQVGHLVFNPGNVELSLEQGQTTSTEVELQNDGSAAITLRLSLSPDDRPVAWLDSVYESDLTDATGDTRLRGIKYVDGQFFVTGSNNFANPNKIYVLDEQGNLVREMIQPGSDQPDADMVGMYDLAFDGTNLWGSDGHDVVAFNPETGEEVSRFEGPYNPNRTLAYDPDHGWLWIGESMRDLVAYDPATGQEVTRMACNLIQEAIEFVPNEIDGYNLFVMAEDDSSARAIYRMNMETEDMQRMASLPDAGERTMLGLTYAPGYNMYYVALVGLINGMPNDRLKAWQMDATVGFADLSQIDYTLEAGESGTVTLSIDAADLTAQEYNVYMVAEHNSLEEQTYEPIHLTVLDAVGEQAENGLPTTFALEQPYPNPFNGMSTVRFDVPRAGMVRLAVFDILGRRVAQLQAGNLAPGRYAMPIMLEQQASGIYFVRMSAESGFQAVRKVVLVK